MVFYFYYPDFLWHQYLNILILSTKKPEKKDVWALTFVIISINEDDENFSCHQLIKKNFKSRT